MHRPAYADMAVKFVEHFLWIAAAMMHAGRRRGDVGRGGRLLLRRAAAARRPGRAPEGALDGRPAAAVRGHRLRRRARRAASRSCGERFRRFLEARPELRALHPRPGQAGPRGPAARRGPERGEAAPRAGERCSTRRSSSAPTASARCPATTPSIRTCSAWRGQEYRVSYLPAESDSGMFGGNSNWRGPIWMPVNALIIRALLQYYVYYGDDFTIECPTGSGRQMTLYQVAEEIARRLASIFLAGRGRPAAGLRGHAEVPGGSALARSHPVLRVLPRRQRRRPRREPPDRLDRRRRPGHAPVRDEHGRRSSSSTARRPAPWRRSRAASSPRRAGAEPEDGRAEMDRPALSLALSDQHARLADRAVARARPAGHAGRHPGRRAGPPGRDGLRLGLAAQRVADRRRPGSAISRSNPEWRREFEETLPDLREEDIAGSGFAITGYTVHPALGRRCGAGPAARAPARARPPADARLRPQPHRRSTIPGSSDHPDYYVAGTETDLARAPQNYTLGHAAGAATCSSPTAAIRTSRAGPTRCSSTTATRPRRRR